MGLKIIPNPGIGYIGSGHGLSVVGGGAAQNYTQRMKALFDIAYWPLNEPAGTTGAGSVLDASGNARTGTPSNVTFGATGIGDGNTAATFNGTSSYINVSTASLISAFSGAVGSFCGWYQASASAVWADGVWRQLMVLRVNAQNDIQIVKTSTNNQTYFEYLAANTTESYTATFNPTAWFHLAITWSKANERVKIYMNGSQIGTTLINLGVFTGSLATLMLGATNTTPIQVWKGGMAHVGLSSIELNDAQVISAANP